MKLLENKGLNVYKELLNTLHSYTERMPATSAERVYRQCLEQGVRVVPKNKLACSILEYVLGSKESDGGKIQSLMNMKFTDLPVEYRPSYKEGNRVMVAFWHKDGKTYDGVISLLNLTGKSEGKWSDIMGENVKVSDNVVQKDKK